MYSDPSIIMVLVGLAVPMMVLAIIVVKSHGGTDSLGFGYAIEEAVAEVRGNVTGHIQEQVSRRLAALEPGDATLSS